MRWWRCGAMSALAVAVASCAAPTDVTVQGSGRVPGAGEAVAATQSAPPTVPPAAAGSTSPTTPPSVPTSIEPTSIVPTTSVTMPAGFCPIQAGEVAVFTLSEEGFTPACLTVQANQAVEVVNRTGAPVVVTLAGVLDVDLVEPAGRVRSPAVGGLVTPASYPLVAGPHAAEVRVLA